MQPKIFTILEKITPIWFSWLGWLLSVGAIGFIAEKTKLLSISIIYGISYVFFFMYITHMVSKIMHLELLKNKSLNKIAMFILAVLIMSLSTLAIHQAVPKLASGG